MIKRTLALSPVLCMTLSFSVRGALQENDDAFASKYHMQAKIVNNNIKKILADIEATADSVR